MTAPPGDAQLIQDGSSHHKKALDEAAARRLTDRIRYLAQSVAEQIEKMAGLIDEARAGSAWSALGYDSWTAYVATEFAGVLGRLDREPRQEFVRELTARGMSSRAIAPLVGSSDRQVRRDMTGGTDVPPAPQTPAPESDGEANDGAGQTPGGASFPSRNDVPATDEGEPEASPVRPPVTGLDGKTYTRPQPRHDEQSWPAGHPVHLLGDGADIAIDVDLDDGADIDRLLRDCEPSDPTKTWSLCLHPDHTHRVGRDQNDVVVPMPAALVGRARPPVPSRPGKTAEQLEREAEAREIEQGIRTTNVNAAEAVRTLAAQSPATFVASFLPHHDRVVVEGMRLTSERCEQAIELLRAIQKELDK